MIGQFWMAHHRMFRLIGCYDTGLLRLNLLGLLTVTFLPFPTAVLGAVEDTHHLEVVFYAASLTATSLALVLMWTYARTHGLLVPGLPPEQIPPIHHRLPGHSGGVRGEHRGGLLGPDRRRHLLGGHDAGDRIGTAPEGDGLTPSLRGGSGYES